MAIMKPDTSCYFSYILQIFLNVIGGAITVAIIEICKWWRRNYIRRKFKDVFGGDIFTPNKFHLSYAHLALCQIIDEKGNPVKYPYVKPGEEKSGAAFSIKRPVSSCEVRAAKYLTEVISKEARVAPVLSSDIEIKGRLDISFIAFGGPLSNYKTRDTIDNSENYLIKFNNQIFSSSKSGRPVVKRENSFDYGLILKIHPSQFPNRSWFTCCGLGEWGTSGAAWYLAHRWKDIHKFASNAPFAIIVRVKEDQDESAEEVIRIKSSNEAERLASSL
jgi:hypothetical protein